ncbi:MAG TPA: GSU2403 family nucleotidyltransferase fold protein [Rhodocyclaceae bacterium]
MGYALGRPLYRLHELAFRTQYGELKERTQFAGELLPGTPGSLALRKGSGRAYWYRVFYSVPGKVAETLVAREGDEAALEDMRLRMGLSEWAADQVSALRKLSFQVADKKTARVLVELHNRGAFEAGLVLVGTLGYMAWLNELGVMAVSARTLDVDLARRQQLKLATPLPFLETMKATGLPFVAVPGLPSTAPSTSIKLPGVEGLRVDVLAPGPTLGAAIAVPELAWTAQAIPHYDYLLADAEPGAMLAGGHCVPVRLPQAARLVWHKLYAATQRQGAAEKAAKDEHQALVLAAVLADEESHALAQAFADAPEAMIKPIHSLKNRLIAKAAAHPALAEMLDQCLGT